MPACPAATGNAIFALTNVNQTAFQHDLKGPLARLGNTAPPFEIRVQRNYNPEGVTQYNIVPGLTGTILTMTMTMTMIMIMMIGMAMTRELERGTMENLLTFPVHPLEVMIGKILPYIMVGYIQVTVILVAAHFLFSVPIAGSLPLTHFLRIVRGIMLKGNNWAKSGPMPGRCWCSCSW